MTPETRDRMQVNETTAPFGNLQTETPIPEQTPKDEFLKLLVAQLQHQDPLEPQSGAEFVAQLAQFAQLEVGVETNNRLAALEATQAAMSRTGMASLVGQQIEANADQVRLEEPGTEMPLTVDLSGPANSAEVVIYDEFGEEVKRIELGATSGGEIDVVWDGTDAKGVPVEKGNYRIDVLAAAPDGTEVEAGVSLQGLVTAMEFVDGEAFFRIGGALISPADIESVWTP